MLLIKDLSFSYRKEKPVLLIPELKVEKGEKIFLHGPSGSGKTTLLGLLAGILSPQAGSISIAGKDLCQMSQQQKDHFRGQHLGYIFQMFNLIPYLSVRDNIELPCKINSARGARLSMPILQASLNLAKALGIESLINQRVAELSVGQQQRVAAARALMGAPDLIIADEPTSALDSDHREKFLKLLFSQCESKGATLIFVSHDMSLAKLFSRTLSLRTLNKIDAGALNSFDEVGV